MTIYRVAESSRLVPGVAPSLVHARYFIDRRRALMVATDLAQLYAGMHRCRMTFQPVDSFDVVGIWRDQATDPNHEIRIDKGEIEDGPAED